MEGAGMPRSLHTRVECFLLYWFTRVSDLRQWLERTQNEQALSASFQAIAMFLPLNPFASRMLQQQGRRFCSEESSQGLTEIRIVVVPIHALKIAPSIDCEEFEGLGHSWLSESEVHVMGQMPG